MPFWWTLLSEYTFYAASTLPRKIDSHHSSWKTGFARQTSLIMEILRGARSDKGYETF
jgi:hypothetical protein